MIMSVQPGPEKNFLCGIFVLLWQLLEHVGRIRAIFTRIHHTAPQLNLDISICAETIHY